MLELKKNFSSKMPWGVWAYIRVVGVPSHTYMRPCLPKPPAIKTDKEKEELRRKMRNKYEVKFDIPERILYMALESVLYDEEQANALM